MGGAVGLLRGTWSQRQPDYTPCAEPSGPHAGPGVPSTTTDPLCRGGQAEKINEGYPVGMAGAARLRGKAWGEGPGWEAWLRDSARCSELGSWPLPPFPRGHWAGVRGFGCLEDMWEGETAGPGLAPVHPSLL